MQGMAAADVMTLAPITAPALAPLRHGFFTRRGGASSGVFAGLNCGTGSSDQADAVAINRDRVARAMDVPEAGLVALSQTHSARVAIISIPPAPGARADADAAVTGLRGLALSVLTADCAPVLFADAGAGVIGAAHAGWRGALDGILEATLAAMVGLGANPAETVAVVGPTISQPAYEVGPEFRETFLRADPANDRFFAPGHADRHHFDLPAYALHRLAGVGLARWTGDCTYTDPGQFFSYRRSVHAKEADYGRLISAIAR